MKPQDTFEKTAVYGKNNYNHFGIRAELASLYGDDPEDIVTLKLKVSDDQTIPETHKKEADYWGWYDNDRKEFTMIHAQRFLLNMCFPNGMEASEGVNQGKGYRLEIIK